MVGQRLSQRVVAPHHGDQALRRPLLGEPGFHQPAGPLFVWIRPVLHTLPNAYLELSRYEPIGGVERLIGEFGAERFIYGSWFGRYAMGPILFYLHHLAISEEQLALLCAGNLERILAEAGSHD